MASPQLTEHSWSELDASTDHHLGVVPALDAGEYRERSAATITKRVIDVVVATIVLLISLPLLVLCGCAVVLESNGPAIFRQTRIGRDGVPFTMYKLRTMVDSAEADLHKYLHLNQADGPLFKVDDDPRVTPIGRWLRKLSIDELPQLWNVIRGDMSLVGPRPALPREVDEWPLYLHRRLEVPPGITGMWQVSGRADCSFDEYAEHDLRYVDEWSPAGDLVILAKTVPAVINRRGAA